jgi:hypothetical protein
VIKKSYQYYDDATLKFTQDQLTINSKFDRKYEYDHVGRVIKGLTGQEARGGGTTSDRPYNETHTYDEFNHLRLRFVRQWSRLPSGSGGEFTNNRMSDWQYDSDGRPLSGSTGTYSYDAAGAVESFGDSAPYKTDQQFDGDGVRLKSTLNNFESGQWSVEKVTYYIHSTVLSGAVVSELTEQGAEEHTYVHWNGAVLAVQNVAGSTQWVQWKHFDASSATYRATNSSGQVGESAEMDIVGANAGLFNTNPWPVPKSSGELQPYFSTSDLNSKTECSLASPKKDDGAGGRGVDEGSGGIPMPCVLLDSMGRGDAIGSIRSYGFSMGSKHAVWVAKNTSWFTVDPETEIQTKHNGPGGVYVWIDDPGATWVNPKKSDCAEFVDNQLISKAKDFVYRNKDALGRELLFSIPYNQTEREKKYFNMPVSGFKDRLIKNQGGWVYAHISGIAGATLIGNARVVAWMSQTGNQLIDKQMKEDRKELSDVEDMALLGLAYYDYYGTLRPLNEVLEEKRSEVADNEAGKQVGQILDDVMDRKISYEDARDKLFELLCDK